jgi:hypothetical protein
MESPNLDGFGYDEHCNLHGNHIKGKGSDHLLNVALQFIIHHYKLPTDTTFQFKDKSYIKCNAYKLPLPVYYTIYHGQTWYESKFGARPLFIDEIVLQNQRAQLRDYLKTKPSIDELFQGLKQDKLKAVIAKIYDNSNNLKDCLSTLKDYDCSIFKNWLTLIVVKHIPLLLGTEWYIQCKNNITMKVKELPYKPVELFNLSSMGGGEEEKHLSFRQHEL